jgi:hypothetical protein
MQVQFVAAGGRAPSPPKVVNQAVDQAAGPAE